MVFSKMTSLYRQKTAKKFRDAAKALDEAVEPDYDETGEYCGGKSLRPQSGIKKEDAFL